MEPENIFQMGTNCMAALDAAEKLNVDIEDINAADICDANQKAVRTFIWQLLRLHSLQIIGSKTEHDLLKWVSQTDSVNSFNDPKFANARLLLKLAETIEPKIVNWDVVSKGLTYKARYMNAKYAISIARKLGSAVWLVPDDIPSLNEKMILIFVCTLYGLHFGVVE